MPPAAHTAPSLWPQKSLFIWGDPHPRWSQGSRDASSCILHAGGKVFHTFTVPACAREGCTLPLLPRLRLPLVPQDAHLSPGTIEAQGPEPPVAASEGQLLAWARDTYRGITSYSELRDPRWIQVRLGEGAWGQGLALGDQGGQRCSSCS